MTLSIPKINFYVYHSIVLDIITREINCCCWWGNLFLLLLLRLYSVGDTWMNKYGALVEWYCQEKPEVLTEKPVPVTLNPMRNPHSLAVILTNWGNLWSYKVSRQVLLLHQHAWYTGAWGQKLFLQKALMWTFCKQIKTIFKLQKKKKNPLIFTTNTWIFHEIFKMLF